MTLRSAIITGTASININGTVGATTPSTGAFTTINSTDTTDSTSSITGAVKTAGGLGVAKAVYIGTSLTVGATANLPTVYSQNYSTTIYDIRLAGTNKGIDIGTNGSANTGTAMNFNSNYGASIGNISVGATTTYNTTSDYRLKDNIKPMTNVLAKIALLKPVTYQWKFDDSKGEGFIAHELAEVFPMAVTGEKDAIHEDGSIKPQSMDSSVIVAALAAAIQEQQAIIATLTDRIAALEKA